MLIIINGDEMGMLHFHSNEMGHTHTHKHRYHSRIQKAELIDGEDVIV